MKPDSGEGRPSPDGGAGVGTRLEERLFPGIGPGIRLGLDRVEGALADLGAPHLRYPALQVGGTNGKGSVAVVWASILRSPGLRVGLYTSPHLCTFRERFLVDGAPASQQELQEGAELIRPLAHRHGLSFFEASTALAFHIFASRNVDVAVLEVGLGGRLDATRVAAPVLTAVTNVALDHREYLGDTLEAVAREKAGLARRDIPFITSERDPMSRQVLRDGATEAGAPFRFMDPAEAVRHLRWDRSGTAFRLETAPWGSLPIESPLLGAYQAGNVALAVRALEDLPPDLMPGKEAVMEGVGHARNPGRLQLVPHDGLTWLLDVAHNPAGAGSLAASLERLALPEPVRFVVGILADKDGPGILAGLGAPAEATVLTVPPSAGPGRAWKPREVAHRMDLSARVEEDFPAALQWATEGASPGGTIVVTGSFTTVGDALLHLGCSPWPQVTPSPALPAH